MFITKNKAVNFKNKHIFTSFFDGREAAHAEGVVKKTCKNVFIFLKLSVLFLENEASVGLNCQVVALKTQCISNPWFLSC